MGVDGEGRLELRNYEARVAEIIRETPDAITLMLDIGGPADFLAGQFITINPHLVEGTKELAKELEERKKRKERPRSYSLGNAPHEPLLAVTVKEEPAGEFPALVSPWLMRDVKVGDQIAFNGFSGFYTLPDDLPEGAHVVHVCAGTGIVPNFSIIKDALHRKLPIRQTLLFSNRRWEDVIYAEELRRLEAESDGRLRVVHALTRDPEAPGDVTVRSSRIDGDMLRNEVPDFANAWFFVCGPSIPLHEKRTARLRGETAPPRFLETMKETLQELEIPRARVRSEGW